MALGAMAATPHRLQSREGVKITKRADIKDAGNLRMTCTPSSMMKVPAKVFSPDDIITSAEGDTRDVVLIGSGYYLFYGSWLALYENEDGASHLVYGEDNDVYIYDLLPNLPVGAYVKGELREGKLVVDLPQIIYWEEEAQEGFVLGMYDYKEYEEIVDGQSYTAWDYEPSETKSLTFDIAEDGSMVAEGLGEESLVLGAGYATDEVWAGYCAWDLSMVPFNETPVTAPDDIEVSKDFWSFKSFELGYGWTFSWAQGSDEVYFQGLSPMMPEAWVKATVEYGDTEACLSIAQDQYVGKYQGYYIYTKCVKIMTDDEGFEDFVLLPADYEYQLVWDYEENTMVAKDPDVFLLFNASKTAVSYLDEFYDFIILHQESFDGTPLNPSNLEYVDFMQDFGEIQFAFDAPAFSTDGELLLTEDLYYVVYVDGEKWTFDASEYELEESMVEIPWDFYSQLIGGYGAKRVVVFFVEGISSLGAQLVYRHNGVETCSEIVTLDLDPGSVAGIGADRKVSSVRYYDVAGCEVANPSAGIFIKRVVYEDGTVASFKKLVR